MGQYEIFKLKGNVTVYKDLNIEFVTKKGFVTRTQCKNAIKPYSSRAYCLFYARIRYDFVCDGDRACRATVKFQDRLQTLIDCAQKQTARQLETKRRCIHPGSDSRRPFVAHLPIHYHLQLLSHPRLKLISTTES